MDEIEDEGVSFTPWTPEGAARLQAAANEAARARAVEAEFGPDHLDLFRAANAECADAAFQQYPLPEMDSERKRALYEAELENLECIEEQGIDLPSPPSEQAYIDGYETEGWKAAAELTPENYPQLFDDGGQRYRELLTACVPPTREL